MDLKDYIVSEKNKYVKTFRAAEKANEPVHVVRVLGAC